MSSSDGNSDSFAPPALWTARTQKRNAAITRDMNLIHARLDGLNGVTNDMNAKLDTILKALAQLTAPAEHINIPLTESTIQSELSHIALRASLERMENEIGSLIPQVNVIQGGPISIAEPESECSPTKYESPLPLSGLDDLVSKCQSYEMFSGVSFCESDDAIPDESDSQVDYLDHLHWARAPRANEGSESPTASINGVENCPEAPRVPPISVASIIKQFPDSFVPASPRGLEVCRAYNGQSNLFDGCQGADSELERHLKKRLERSEGGAAMVGGPAIEELAVKRSPRWHFTPRGSLRQWLFTPRGSNTSPQLYRMQPINLGVPESLESIPLA